MAGCPISGRVVLLVGTLLVNECNWLPLSVAVVFIRDGTINRGSRYSRF